MRVRLTRIAAAAAIAIGVSVGAATPANADPFGLDTPFVSVSGVGAIPDTLTHWYCFSGSGWTAAWQTIVNGRMANLDTETVYSDAFDSTCDSLTDIWFVIDNGLGSRGAYDCITWNNGDDDIPASGDEECERATIWINPSVLTDDHQRRKTVCHEVGHSVGLAHGTNTGTFWNDCMFSGQAPAGTQYEQYNGHHEDHADSRTPANS